MWRQVKIATWVVAAVVAVCLWRGRAGERELAAEPVFYSDWVKAFVRVPAWEQVSHTEAETVNWLKLLFEREGVPPELVWVAAVESSFDPLARSHRGAVGLFQLMPETAARQGLSTHQPDERLDPRRNAEAAARYLASLHHRFDSWPLALAAFNAGQGRVSRALRFRAASDYDQIASMLPAETRSYVPRVLAMILYREGVDAFELPPPGVRGGHTLAWVEAPVPRQVF